MSGHASELARLWMSTLDTTCSQLSPCFRFFLIFLYVCVHVHGCVCVFNLNCGHNLIAVLVFVFFVCVCTCVCLYVCVCVCVYSILHFVELATGNWILHHHYNGVQRTDGLNCSSFSTNILLNLYCI